MSNKRRSYNNVEMRLSEREKIHHFYSSLKVFFLASLVLWTGLTIICWVLLYDFNYGSKSHLSLIANSSLLMHSLLLLFCILLFAVIVGVLISIPVIGIKVILHGQLQARLKNGPNPFLLKIMEKNIPVLMFIIFHALFIFLNFAAAPQLFINLLGDKNPIYLSLQETNKLFFTKSSRKIYKQWLEVGQSKKIQDSFIFLVPESYLVKNENFPKTKAILTHTSPILLTDSSIGQTVSSLLGAYPEGDYRLSLPAPLSHEDNSIYGEGFLPFFQPGSVFIGLDTKNTSSLAWLFKDSIPHYQQRQTWFEIFLNRTALAMPQFMLFFRSGLAGEVFSQWSWSEIDNQDYQLFLEYSENLLEKNGSYQQGVFLLSGLEPRHSEDLIHTISTGAAPTAVNYREADLFLSQAISGVLKAGLAKIAVVPYPDSNSSVHYSSAYSNFKVTADRDTLKTFLTSGDIGNHQVCQLTSANLDLSRKVQTYNWNLLLDVLSPSQSDFVTLDKNFILMAKNMVTFMSVCTTNQSTFLLVDKNDIIDENNYDPERKLISDAVSTFKPILPTTKKKDAKKENQNYEDIFLSSQKVHSDPLESFFKQLAFFKIQNETNPYFVNPSVLEQQELFKEYGSFTKSLIYSQSKNWLEY